MAANSTSTEGGDARNAAAREVNQLKKKLKELTLRLEHVVKARKLDARLTRRPRGSERD